MLLFYFKVVRLCFFPGSFCSLFLWLSNELVVSPVQEEGKKLLRYNNRFFTWVAFVRLLNQTYWAILNATLKNVGYIEMVVNPVYSVSCSIVFSFFVLDAVISSCGPTYSNRNNIGKIDSYLIENMASELQKSAGKC